MYITSRIYIQYVSRAHIQYVQYAAMYRYAFFVVVSKNLVIAEVCCVVKSLISIVLLISAVQYPNLCMCSLIFTSVL